jgi:hypothetical protein
VFSGGFRRKIPRLRGKIARLEEKIPRCNVPIVGWEKKIGRCKVLSERFRCKIGCREKEIAKLLVKIGWLIAPIVQL